MDRSRREARAEELLERADRLPPEERKNFLDVECAGDPALRAELDRLLPFADDPKSREAFMKSPVGRQEVSNPGATTVQEQDASDGDRIGPYRLLQRIGEGGMGEVFLAEQSKPVRRRVALKLIKAGLDSSQVLLRFEAERQALALMDHGSIARVYDAGSTPQGRPYFAMEYVKGEPITSYCDRQRLDTRQRIELFCKVCAGVQHAHQKGIIHRDLKPTNVLVTLEDGVPAPKIIDFGVAKATAQRLTEATMFTQLGTLVGTPEYMSPEQAELTGLDVDTRSDVYSLGVMLYELLVGALPFESMDLRSAGVDEIRRRIREDDPSRPSTKVGTLTGDASLETARRRRTTVPALRKELKGDLDWITMRALEKDRTRRYGSPETLAADLQRHLADEPVLAGPPSQVYRTRKFVRRHRVGVTAAGLVLVALIGGLSVAVYGMVRARRAEVAAREEAATAERISEFMAEIFREPSPYRSRGETVTAMEILDRGAERVETELAGQPKLKARMTAVMGLTYFNLGLYQEARGLLESSLTAASAFYGDGHDETARTRFWLGGLLHSMGEDEESERLMLEALDTFRDRHGEKHKATVDVMSALGWHYAERGRFVEADPLLTRTLDLRRASLGADDGLTLLSMFELGFLRFWQGRADEAEALHADSLEARRRLFGDDSPATLDSMNALAIAYRDQGRHDEAEALFKECLAIKRRVFGNDHPVTAYTTDDLGVLYSRVGRYDEAEPLLRETVRIRRTAYGEGHPEIFLARRDLALMLERQGRLGEAEAIYREALDHWEEIEGEHGLHTLDVRLLLASTLKSQGYVSEADAMYVRVAEARRRSVDDIDLPINLDYNLACYAALGGRHEEALEHLRRRARLGGVQAWMLEDADLRSLHGDPEFESIFAPIRQSVTPSD